LQQQELKQLQPNNTASKQHLVGVIIPVTRRIKGYEYIRFAGMYIIGRRKRFRPYKLYIYILDQDYETSRSSHVRLSVWTLWSRKL